GGVMAGANGHAGNGHDAGANGYWRAVGAEEIFAPGRQFRLDQTTGQSEVFEPSGSPPPEGNGHGASDSFFGHNPFPGDGHDHNPGANNGNFRPHSGAETASRHDEG